MPNDTSAFCPDEETIMAHIAGEDDPKARECLARHILECSSCRQTAADFKIIIQQSSAIVESLAINRDFTQSIQAIIEKLPNRTIEKNRIKKTTHESVSYWNLIPTARWLSTVLAFSFILLALGIAFRRFDPNHNLKNRHKFSFALSQSGVLLQCESNSEFQPTTTDQLHSGMHYRLSEGSSLQTSPGAALELSLTGPAFFQPDESEWVLSEGHAHLTGMPGHKAFRLRTPHVAINVIGTDIKIEISPNETSVQLIEGRIKLETQLTQRTIEVSGRWKINNAGQIIQVKDESNSPEALGIAISTPEQAQEPSDRQPASDTSSEDLFDR